MRHLNPELERLEERVAPCLSYGLTVCIGLCGGGQESGDGGDDGCSGSSYRSNDGSSCSGSGSSKSKSHGSCSS
jgi:hypothetical protein